MLFNLRLNLLLLLIKSQINNTSEAHESCDSSTAPLTVDGQNDTLSTLEMFRGITTATHIRANFKGELE